MPEAKVPLAVAVQIRFLSDERAVLAEDLARATAKAQQLELQHSQALAEREALRAELAKAQEQAHSMATAMQTITADKVILGCTPSRVSSHSAIALLQAASRERYNFELHPVALHRTERLHTACR